MKQFDICAGIGSFSEAGRRAGFVTTHLAEIQPKRQQVLNDHFPDAIQLGDLYGISSRDIQGPINLVTGGTPCPDFSISGPRRGLAGERGQLFFQYRRLVQELRPDWFVWENVPGVLSTHGGWDFAQILQGMAELGYGLAWRVLDAQHWGVPQRRRRVFLVGHRGTGRAAQVLFDEESYPRGAKSQPASRQPRRVAGTLAASRAGVQRMSGQRNEGDFIVLEKKRTDHYVPSDRVPPPLERDWRDWGSLVVDHIHNDDSFEGMRLRRFTPLEVARLQGFPDDWLKGYSDHFAYSAYGDSIALPVSEWLMRRVARHV